MSLELIIKALVNLGLSRLDAEIYVYIAKMGSQTVKDLDGALNYSKNQIYKSLRTLTAKALITKEGIKFSAIPFEEALDMLIEREKKQSNHIKERKRQFLQNRKNVDRYYISIINLGGILTRKHGMLFHASRATH